MIKKEELLKVGLGRSFCIGHCDFGDTPVENGSAAMLQVRRAKETFPSNCYGWNDFLLKVVEKLYNQSLPITL